MKAKGYYKVDIEEHNIIKANCSLCEYGHFHGDFTWRWCEYGPIGHKSEKNKNENCKNFKSISKFEKIFLRFRY